MSVPFAPIPGATVNIDVSSSSQSVQINNGGGSQVRIMNNGTATVWIRFATADAVAATLAAGMPVGPGVTEVVTKATGPVWVSAIAAGSTGKIYFTPGSGI